jgi:hypothetical protein
LCGVRVTRSGDARWNFCLRRVKQQRWHRTITPQDVEHALLMHLDAQNGVEYTLAVQRSAWKGSYTKQEAKRLQEAQLNGVPMQFYRLTPAETHSSRRDSVRSAQAGVS